MAEVFNRKTFFATSGRFHLIALLIFVCSACNKTAHDIDEIDADLRTRAAPLREEALKESQYLLNDELEALSKRCASSTCSFADFSRWIEILPDQKYYDKLAELENSLYVNFRKLTGDLSLEDDDLQLYAAEKAKRSLVVPLQGQQLLAGAQVIRILRQLHANKIKNEKFSIPLRKKTKDYLCADLKGAMVGYTKVEIVNSHYFPNLFKENLKLDASRKIFEDFRLTRNFVNVRKSCPWWKRFVFNLCARDYYTSLTDYWGVGDKATQEINQKIKASLCNAP